MSLSTQLRAGAVFVLPLSLLARDGAGLAAVPRQQHATVSDNTPYKCSKHGEGRSAPAGPAESAGLVEMSGNNKNNSGSTESFQDFGFTSALPKSLEGFPC